MGPHQSKAGGGDDFLGFEEIFTSWCTGYRGKEEKDGKMNDLDKAKLSSNNPQTASNYLTDNVTRSNSSFASWSTPRSTSKRRSSMELASAMEDGETKQRYLNSAHLDEALVSGLITPDDYAQKLKRLDSLFVEQQQLEQEQEITDEEERIQRPAGGDIPSSSPRLNQTF